MEEKNKRKTISPPKYNAPEELKEQARAFVKAMLKENNITYTEMAKMCKDAYGRSDSRVSMINKFKRASFKLTEVMQIADLFGYEIKFVPKSKIEDNEKISLK